MSNILFALYHDFRANSAVHVHNFANELAAAGHSVAVAFPAGDNAGSALGEQRYASVRYPDVTGDWAELFGNDNPPDILHAWTPRENVRLFAEKVRGLCSPLLFVHLEDNEELILETNLGTPFQDLAAAPPKKLPANLSHPRNYRRFLAEADGITVIMDRLEKFVPPHVPTLTLWPGADRELFVPRPKDDNALANLGVPRGNVVLSYTGNVHSANAREVRSLYLAAAMLTREGVPTTLLRAGDDYCPFLGPDESWARQVSIELGYMNHVDVPHLLSLADFLIQPGTDDAFNEFRLPAKLPEFFAMGRPVVLPRTNVGRFVRHGEEAWVLEKVDALGITEAVLELHNNKTLSERLAAGAGAFAREHFDWKKNAGSLDAFYQKIAASPPQQSTHAPTSTLS